MVKKKKKKRILEEIKVFGKKTVPKPRLPIKFKKSKRLVIKLADL